MKRVWPGFTKLRQDRNFWKITVFTEPSKKYVLHIPSGSEQKLQRTQMCSVNRTSSIPRSIPRSIPHSTMLRALDAARLPEAVRKLRSTLIYVNVSEGIHVFPKHIKTHPKTSTLGLIYGSCVFASATWMHALWGKRSSLLRGTCRALQWQQRQSHSEQSFHWELKTVGNYKNGF